MAKKKHKKTKKKTNILVIIIIVLAAILLISLMRISLTDNVIKGPSDEEKKEMEAEKEWLMDNCECIARDIIRCMEGFELVEDICKNNTLELWTPRLLSCSKYDCTGEIRELTKEYYWD